MTSPNGTLIKMEGVSKVFYTDESETYALSAIDLEIKKGEYLAIAGPSGCGKSTLLAILGLLDSPTEGNYSLNGQAGSSLKISERSRIRNREIGFLFQAFNLIGDLTLYENVELPLTYRGMAAAERKEKVHRALERVKMAHRTKHYPTQLSGGQQQRVAVARALVGDPMILLADEPTGNLDSKNGDSVMDLLRDIHRSGATICMVTHVFLMEELLRRQMPLHKKVIPRPCKVPLLPAGDQPEVGFEVGSRSDTPKICVWGIQPIRFFGSQ